MSVYRCGMCESTKDADYEGCFEHPTSETECICYNCSLEVSCFRCQESKFGNKYCKISEVYFCEACV